MAIAARTFDVQDWVPTCVGAYLGDARCSRAADVAVVVPGELFGADGIGAAPVCWRHVSVTFKRLSEELSEVMGRPTDAEVANLDAVRTGIGAGEVLLLQRREKTNGGQVRKRRPRPGAHRR